MRALLGRTIRRGLNLAGGFQRLSDSKNLWGGRFTGEADPGFAEFNRSFSFDRRLFAADVRASLAHAEGLSGAGVLSNAEAGRIRNGLQTILKRAATDARYFDE